MPWGPSYLLPAEYSVQAKWPPYSSDVHFGGNWMVVGYDGPIPPVNYNGPYWFLPSDQWPPIEKDPKVFGAISARKIHMYSKNPDPPGELQSHPPFGTFKFDTPTDRPHSIGTLKIYMRQHAWLEINPLASLWKQVKLKAALQEMSRKRPIRLRTEYGTITIKAIRSAAWSQHDAEFKQRKEAMKAREERAAELLAAQNAKTNEQSQPSKGFVFMRAFPNVSTPHSD